MAVTYRYVHLGQWSSTRDNFVPNSLSRDICQCLEMSLVVNTEKEVPLALVVEVRDKYPTVHSNHLAQNVNSANFE